MIARVESRFEGRPGAPVDNCGTYGGMGACHHPKLSWFKFWLASDIFNIDLINWERDQVSKRYFKAFFRHGRPRPHIVLIAWVYSFTIRTQH